MEEEKRIRPTGTEGSWQNHFLVWVLILGAIVLGGMYWWQSHQEAKAEEEAAMLEAERDTVVLTFYCDEPGAHISYTRDDGTHVTRPVNFPDRHVSERGYAIAVIGKDGNATQLWGLHHHCPGVD